MSVDGAHATEASNPIARWPDRVREVPIALVGGSTRSSPAQSAERNRVIALVDSRPVRPVGVAVQFWVNRASDWDPAHVQIPACVFDDSTLAGDRIDSSEASLRMMKDRQSVWQRTLRKAGIERVWEHAGFDLLRLRCAP